MKFLRTEPLRQHRFDDTQFGFLDRLFIKREKERPDFNQRMFDEDFSRIFNFESRHGGKLFKVGSNNQELTERLLANVQTRNGPREVDETVREWLEDIVQSLLWVGAAHYYLSDDAQDDDIHILSFGPSGVVRIFGCICQWVPKRIERSWDKDGEESPRELRILDSTRVMRFELPKAISRMLRAQNKTLSVLDRHQFDEINLHPRATYENPNPINYFDFSVWRDAHDRALYRSTRRTGWNGRKYHSPKCSDFFNLHRMITFRRNQLSLRDDVLRQLCSELTKVGKHYDDNFFVQISLTDQLPSIEQLDQLEVELSREEAGFNDVIDFCYKR
jgi:hypothetical protein